MTGSKFDLTGRILVLCIIIMFLFAYLFQNLLVALVGASMLIYLSYRRMEFHSMLRRLDLRLRRRIMETIVHKGSPATMTMEISSDEPVDLEIKEHIPGAFDMVSGETKFRGISGPDSSLQHSYSFKSRERGLFKVEPPRSRISERRDLFSTERRLGDPFDIFARASKMEIQLARLMSKRKQFEITGPAHKRHTRTYRSDFRSVRDYMPGDRFRDMDWKAGARLTKLMTKEFEQETNLPTIVMVDTSLSMKEMIHKRSKMDHAIAIAIQIVIVMDSHNHPVGMISFDENKVTDHLSPGKQDIDVVLLSLFKLPNPVLTGSYPGVPSKNMGPTKEHGSNTFVENIGPFLVKGRRQKLTKDKATGIFEAVRDADLKEETGLLMVLITDLETNLPSLIKAVKLAIARKHRIVVVSPFSWPYHLDGDDVSPDDLERAYVDREAKKEIIRSLRGAGVKVIEIDPRERGESVLSGIRRLSQ